MTETDPPFFDKTAKPKRVKHVVPEAELQGLYYVIEHEGTEIMRVGVRGELTLGRGKSSDIRLPSNALARVHARFFYTRERFVVVDLDSTNGTFVDEERIRLPKIFTEKHRVRMGAYTLRVLREL